MCPPFFIGIKEAAIMHLVGLRPKYHNNNHQQDLHLKDRKNDIHNPRKK